MGDPVLMRLIVQIRYAESTEELFALRNLAHEQAETWPKLQYNRHNDHLLNEVHDALIARTVALAEEHMAREGRGKPPVPYAYLLFGSGGRKEQTLSSDQDSGIVYGDAASAALDAEAEAYFRHFSIMVTGMLQQVGYPPCDGNIISSNLAWCLSLSGWYGKLAKWFAEAQWEQVRYLLIMADMRLIQGSGELAAELQQSYRDSLEQQPHITRRMLDNTLHHKVIVGFFGQLLKEQYGEQAGRIDIKYGAYIPMVNAIRLLAIRHGVDCTSTLERMEKLANLGVFDNEEKEAYMGAFMLFLQLRAMIPIRRDGNLFDSGGMLPAALLTKDMAAGFKVALRYGRRLQRELHRQAK